MSLCEKGPLLPTMTWRPRRRTRLALLLTLDALAWAGGLTSASALRYSLEPGDLRAPHLAAMVGLTVGVHLVVGLGVALLRGPRGLGSIDDVVDLTTAVALTTVAVFALNVALPVRLVPSSVPITAGLIALGVSAGVRLTARRTRERASAPDRASAQRVLVLGAGQGGEHVVRSMLADGASGYLPVALLDDDREMHRRRICGVAVRGTHQDVGPVAEATGATMLVVAVRDLPNAVLREVVGEATTAGLAVKVLPPLTELFRTWVGFSDLRDLDITDLLRRRPVDTDVASIAGYLAGKRVLVTGAGGSIGSELCRQLHGYGPAELMMLDRDESALHAVQLSIYGRALLDSPDVILADIRDAEAVDAIFADRRPDVVFHAAALKHLPMLEQYPDEAWKTNVIGTQILLDAAAANDVATFVNISTDKAANPISVLGRSKRVAERLVAEAAEETGRGFLSVRFGNVLGSRGSVLTTFAEQLAGGGPLTITHPDVTRFFMTIPEAVQLVIQAAAVGGPGEALVLDMGEPVRIADVARQLMEIAGQGAEVVYTGLREGEKLHEELFGDGEVDARPRHPAISHVAVPALPIHLVNQVGAIEGSAVALDTLVGYSAHARSDMPGPTLSESVVANVRARRQAHATESAELEHFGVATF